MRCSYPFPAQREQEGDCQRQHNQGDALRTQATTREVGIDRRGELGRFAKYSVDTGMQSMGQGFHDDSFSEWEITA